MPDQKGSHAEEVEILEDWYDLNPYADEIKKYIIDKKNDLSHHSRMNRIYDILYLSIFAGAEDADEERRYPFLKEMYNVYKSAIIEACLPGYSALAEYDPGNPETVLLIPELKKTLTEQFKRIALIENLTTFTLPDYIVKGEAVGYIKLKETTERYRTKQTVTDLETGEKIMSFKIKTGVTYEDLVFEKIDPLDFYVDALDYHNDPRGCAKIIRSYISSKQLLSDKSNYPRLTLEDKQAIIQKRQSSDYPNTSNTTNGYDDETHSKTARNQIEVLTYLGDYVTKDGKLLTNIKAVTVEGQLGLLEYNGVDTCQVIYAPYFIDRETHRGVSPLACCIPLDNLSNECIDLFIDNLDKVGNPIFMYTAGSLPLGAMEKLKRTRELEYNDGIGNKPEWYSPPEISQNGLTLLDALLEKQKDTLGLNTYMSGDTSGAVRTAQESQILFQKANARMRVETDTFSYNFLLPLITTFYTFNRELALSVDHPLAPIFSNENLKVTISTGASKADTEGEFNKLMQILGMSAISQPIFQWCAETGNMDLAIRYLMAKAGLTDADNILQLIEENQQTTQHQPNDPTVAEGMIPPVLQGDQQRLKNIMTDAYNDGTNLQEGQDLNGLQ